MVPSTKRNRRPAALTILFVYGTLQRGQRNHHLMREARFLGEAVTEPQYTLLDLGSFPGMIAGGATAVQGELYEVGPELLARLDRHEGVPRFYVRALARVEENTCVESYFLVDPDRIQHGVVIERGIWPASR